MILLKLPRAPITLVSAITLALISCTNYLLPVGAQSARPVNKTPSSGRVRFTPPPKPKQKSPDFSGHGRPGRRAGGGSRSPCPAKDPPLTALMPVTNWGKTVASNPTFWFYVPYSPQEVHSGEFVLQESEGNDIYRTPFTLPKTPGFVSFSIPHTQAPLKINKLYRWYFKLYCEPQKSSAPVFVEGWVQRVALTSELESQLQAAKLREYTVYADNGIWYDAVASLAELSRTNPANPRLDQDWADLLSLRGVGLEKIQQEPIIGQVIPFPLVGSSSSQPIAH